MKPFSLILTALDISCNFFVFDNSNFMHGVLVWFSENGMEWNGYDCHPIPYTCRLTLTEWNGLAEPNQFQLRHLQSSAVTKP